MELNSVNLKSYKKVFWQVLISNATVIAASYLLVANGYFIFSPFYRSQNITSSILAVIILLSFFNSQYQRKQVKQLENYTDFDERVMRHEKIYKARMWWFFISCASACFLYVLGAHTVFLYLAIFDLVITFPSWPNKMIIKRELKNDEIIFL